MKHVSGGGETGLREYQKPTYVYAIGPWAHRLMRTVDKQYKGTVTTATSSVNSSGVKQVTGTKDLKGTQHYTSAFGTAVHQSWHKHVRSKPSVPIGALDFDNEDSDEEGIIFGRTNWHGCDAVALCHDLKIPSDRLVF